MSGTIPRATSEYTDGNIGMVRPGRNDIQIILGGAKRGSENVAVAIGGSSPKTTLDTLFVEGPLVESCKAAFDGGAKYLYAMRIGDPTRASRTLEDLLGVDAVKIEGENSSLGNNVYLNLVNTVASLGAGHMAVISGATKKVAIYNADWTLNKEVALPVEIASAVAVAPDWVLRQIGGSLGFFVLGLDSESNVKVWHIDSAGDVVAADTMDITSLIPAENTASGLDTGGQILPGEFAVTCDKTLLLIDGSTPASPTLSDSLTYTDIEGIDAADMSSTAFVYDQADAINGEATSRKLLALDKTAKKIYSFDVDGETITLAATADISTAVGDDDAVGVDVHPDGGHVFVACHGVASDRIIELDIDWTATPNPTVAVVGSDHALAQTVSGSAAFIISATVTSVLTLQDRNESPAVDYEYSVSGTLAAVTAALIEAVNDGGVFTATNLQSSAAPALMPSVDDDGVPDPSQYDALAGGTDDFTPSNASLLLGLTASEAKKDANWIHVAGAIDAAAYAALSTHCTRMIEVRLAERFALVDMPTFSSAYLPGSSGYRSDLDTYVADLLALKASVTADENLVWNAGEAAYLGDDGSTVYRPSAAAISGVLAGIGVQESLVNKPVDGVSDLNPFWEEEHVEQLIGAGINCIRFEDGLGYIVSEDLTGAPDGSDYRYVSWLRTAYKAGRLTRAAAQPYVGKENEKKGTNIGFMKSAMETPLEDMRDGKPAEIDDFVVLMPVQTAQQRNDGEFEPEIEVQPIRHFRRIRIKVRLK